jgi:hypothetical protein
MKFDKRLKAQLSICLTLAGLAMLEGCSKSYAHPCELITSKMSASLLGTPAVTREAWKLDYETQEDNPLSAPRDGWSAAFGYRFVHACSIEAVAVEARDQGRAVTVFFVEYVDKTAASRVYDAVLRDTHGRGVSVPHAKAFTTSDTATDETLSLWMFKDRVSIDFSVGAADSWAAERFAMQLAGSL